MNTKELLQEIAKGKKSKYNARPTNYRGRNYPSKIEAMRASELDILVETGELFYWISQPEFFLVEGFKYKPDFLVVGYDHKNLQITWAEDVKGFETPRFRDAKRIWTAHGKIPLHILKRKNNRWLTEKVIPGRRENEKAKK